MHSGKNILFLCIVLITFTLNVFGQDTFNNRDTLFSDDSTSGMAKDAMHFVRSGLRVLGAPLHFTVHDWQKTALYTGVTITLFAVDCKAKEYALSHQNEFNSNLFNFDAYHGDKYTLDFSLALYGFGYLLNKDKIRIMGLNSIEAFLYAGAISTAAKAIFGRRRPYGGENQLVFKPFRRQTLYCALPSGHATGAFAVSTVMAKSLRNKLWKGFWYCSAVMVAASRVYHNAHWVSDVFLGGVIGYSVGAYVVDFEKKSKRHIFGKIIQPWIGMSRVGLYVYIN